MANTDKDAMNEEIDHFFLSNSFDEMEKNIMEDEYRISMTKENLSDAIITDMFLDEVDCLKRKLAGEDIDCSVTNQ